MLITTTYAQNDKTNQPLSESQRLESDPLVPDRGAQCRNQDPEPVPILWRCLAVGTFV